MEREIGVAVVDIGTNSTRLLVADVASSGAVSTLVRRSTVTRLGAGVDASGSLSGEAIVLRGTSDILEVQTLQATTGAAGLQIQYTVEWEEDGS